MPKPIRSLHREIGILVVFCLFFIIQLLILSSGVAWIYLDPDQFSFWMLILVADLSIVSGVVATYSFVQYTQEGSLRSLVVALLGANIVLLAFLYLLTHPVTVWSVFSDRRRNMTIVAALGFLITPGVLAGSLAGLKPLTRRSRSLTLLWGVVAQPLVSLSFLLSPEPVFALTGPGLGNLSLVGWILSITIGTSSSFSLVLYLQEWSRTHETITLASSLALVLWILSFLTYLAIDSPIQVAELVWLGGIANGFVLLSAAMIITSVIEPHRALESLVKDRTVQLEESRKETEFYLRLWTHKIGNLLQGISTYLELIGYEAEVVPSLSGFQKTAMDLVRQSTTVNRQVEKLIRIKEKGASITWPVNLSYVLSHFGEEVRNSHDGESIAVELPHVAPQLQVVADDLIDIVFSNLAAMCARQYKENRKIPSIRIRENEGSIQVILGPCSSRSVPEITQWSMTKPSLKQSVVDLDLYMAWLIMERYGGRIEHQRNPDSQEEELALTFRTTSKSSLAYQERVEGPGVTDAGIHQSDAFTL